MTTITEQNQRIHVARGLAQTRISSVLDDAARQLMRIHGETETLIIRIAAETDMVVKHANRLGLAGMTIMYGGSGIWSYCPEPKSGAEANELYTMALRIRERITQSVDRILAERTALADVTVAQFDASAR